MLTSVAATSIVVPLAEVIASNSKMPENDVPLAQLSFDESPRHAVNGAPVAPSCTATNGPAGTSIGSVTEPWPGGAYVSESSTATDSLLNETDTRPLTLKIDASGPPIVSVPEIDPATPALVISIAPDAPETPSSVLAEQMGPLAPAVVVPARQIAASEKPSEITEPCVPLCDSWKKNTPLIVCVPSSVIVAGSAGVPIPSSKNGPA